MNNENHSASEITKKEELSNENLKTVRRPSFSKRTNKKLSLRPVRSMVKIKSIRPKIALATKASEEA